MIEIEDKENFKNWFVNPIKTLSNMPDTGFPILMIAIPLLERYLRCVSGNFTDNLQNNFYDKLLELFPSLANTNLSKDFWNVYRNGLLHQVTLNSQRAKGGVIPPEGWLHDDKPQEIEYDEHENRFFINPRLFAQKAIETINNDFQTFRNPPYPDYPLPVIDERLLGTSVAGKYWK